MFPRAKRLVARRDFDRLYRISDRTHGHFFLIRALPNHQGLTRFGVVMSTKTAKRATVRNRHKRHVRATLAALSYHLPPGWDIFVTIHQVVSSPADWPAFREELRTLLNTRFAR